MLLPWWASEATTNRNSTLRPQSYSVWPLSRSRWRYQSYVKSLGYREMRNWQKMSSRCWWTSTRSSWDEETSSVYSLSRRTHASTSSSLRLSVIRMHCVPFTWLHRSISETSYCQSIDAFTTLRFDDSKFYFTDKRRNPPYLLNGEKLTN